jgi:uncharacterized LabA/DUF88 family protein
MKKAAILVDGEWFRRSLEIALKGQLPHGVTADVMYKNALLALDPNEELFRLFYYDCPPYQGRETNPIDKSTVDFRNLKKFQARSLFLSEMKAKDFVALRLGVARNRGWTLTDGYIRRAIAGTPPNPPLASDVFLALEQKGVDMRIGIDVASLTLKRIVDRVILISGDTDMIPAMKLARREGVQVVLVEVLSPQGMALSKHLDEDTDLCRTITPKP